ncbi:hypothetical protein KC330_g206 [Hortaea werneckii]|nr:hypothetical protein KC330_g206 [Hortaea werneckii]
MKLKRVATLDTYTCPLPSNARQRSGFGSPQAARLVASIRYQPVVFITVPTYEDRRSVISIFIIASFYYTRLASRRPVPVVRIGRAITGLRGLPTSVLAHILTNVRIIAIRRPMLGRCIRARKCCGRDQLCAQYSRTYILVAEVTVAVNASVAVK